MSGIELTPGSYVKLNAKKAEVQESALQRGTVVRIDNVPYGFTSEKMMLYFKQFGTVFKTNVPLNRANGQSARNRGYVLFERAEVAKVAAASMHNYLMLDSLLKCVVLGDDKKHWKLFRKADEEFHVRNNKKIQKMDNPSAEHNEDDLLKRQAEAVRLLAKFGNPLTPEDLGITAEEVLAAKAFTNEKGEMSAAHRKMKKEKKAMKLAAAQEETAVERPKTPKKGRVVAAHKKSVKGAKLTGKKDKSGSVVDKKDAKVSAELAKVAKSVKNYRKRARRGKKSVDAAKPTEKTVAVAKKSVEAPKKKSKAVKVSA